MNGLLCLLSTLLLSLLASAPQSSLYQGVPGSLGELRETQFFDLNHGLAFSPIQEPPAEFFVLEQPSHPIKASSQDDPILLEVTVGQPQGQPALAQASEGEDVGAERRVERMEEASTAPVLIVKEDATLLGQLRRDSVDFSLVLAAVCLIPMSLMVLCWRFYLEQKRDYVFPDIQGSSLMGAPYAAGVGGVISYSSVNQPPSRQREDGLSYLERM